MDYMINKDLYIKKVRGKGKGVFAKNKIPANTTIEISPVLVLSAKEGEVVDSTVLHNYIFLWGPTGRRAAIGLGYSSLYNHAAPPNCASEMDFHNETMRVWTIREIEKDEELSINYHGDINDDSPLWFRIKRH